MTIGIETSKVFKKNKTGVENYACSIIKHLLKIDDENQYILYVNPKEVTNALKNSKFIDNNKNTIIKQLSWPFKLGWTQLRLGAEMIANPPKILFLPAHLLPICHPKKTEVYYFRELNLQKVGIRKIIFILVDIFL